MWLGYRPAPHASEDEAPNLTIVIPAFNEGPMVAQAIRSVASAHYPKNRLEIIAIDDGSRDDTWDHIRAAALEFPKLVEPVRMPENRGKRAALTEGFRRARGEIIVTIDSDSVIGAGSLLALVGCFRNPKVGAAAGKVTVFNRYDGAIPRMLQVQFILAFDVMRAAQSRVGTVYCCPGALTAYRASALREVLDRWISQTFLGAPCTSGEDRAMTNYLLAAGYDAVYQRNAEARTLVPKTYAQLCRMYLRWERSFVREELRFSRIIWKRRFPALIFALVDTLLADLRFPIGYASLFLWFLHLPTDPWLLLNAFLGVGLLALFNLLYYLRSERPGEFLYGPLYAYFSVLTLWWIFPYAVFTVRSSKWLTR